MDIPRTAETVFLRADLVTLIASLRGYAANSRSHQLSYPDDNPMWHWYQGRATAFAFAADWLDETTNQYTLEPAAYVESQPK